MSTPDTLRLWQSSKVRVELMRAGKQLATSRDPGELRALVRGLGETRVLFALNDEPDYVSLPTKHLRVAALVKLLADNTVQAARAAYGELCAAPTWRAP